MRRARLLAPAGGALLAIAMGVAALLLWPRVERVRVELAAVDVEPIVASTVQRRALEPRTIDAYRGLGTWVDGFDYSPPYAGDGVPPVSTDDIEQMAAFGVRTLYLQSGRLDARSPDVLEDRWILTEILMRAAQHDIAVVAWYLPKWTDDDTDFDHLLAAHEFEVLGHRFAGLAVDIEWNEDGLEVDERNRRFLDLTRRVDGVIGDDPLGAIVLPPVQTEVLNTSFWPDFPWIEIAPHYDVWLPMSYWSFRTEPYDDPWAYNTESVDRLRANIGDAEALVHPIGGIGGQVDAPAPGNEPYIANVDQLGRFAQSVVDTKSIGGSIYDWNTLDDAGRASLRNLFESGIASEVGSSE